MRAAAINLRGTVGDAYDNAMAESFFAKLECELIARRTWQTKAQARLDLLTWIETWSLSVNNIHFQFDLAQGNDGGGQVI